MRVERGGRIIWYYAVGDRSVYPDEMRYYGVPEMVGAHPDPYRFNTFGNLLDSPDLRLEDGRLAGSGRRFDVRIHALTMQAPEVETWIRAIERRASALTDVAADWTAHCRWWRGFWERSWIIASDNTLPSEAREKLSGEAPRGRREDADGGALVAQSYNVFRFLMACQSRARVPTKFNGGLFTQPLRHGAGSRQPRHHAVKQPDGSWLGHEDARDWGRRFTFQNQRLLYWPLLRSGDGDLMQPFFRYYSDLLPIRSAITRAWFGHGGAYYRENVEPTGGERDCGRRGTTVHDKPPKTRPGESDGSGYYHSYYFTSGLETLAMMVDYVRHTGDKTFRDEVLAPFARDVLAFFDEHYGRDEGGKVRLDPAMVLETWWIAVNPAPDVAGLRYCLDGMLALGAGSKEDRARWRRFRGEVPEVHLHEIDGRMAIAPARSWKLKRNSENGELYPVFPFRLFGLGHGTEDVVAHTMAHRTVKNGFGFKCWTQDQIHWAYAGNADEAKEGLVRRFRNASTQCRFPMYGSAGPDSCPDFDHFGSGATALQRMLVQEARGKILLLPAWPADWDADFRLHLTRGAVIEGRVVEGKLAAWSIEPRSRARDVVVGRPQPVPARPVIPANDHPLRVGVDHAGGSRFRGAIGRATVFRAALTADAVRKLAAGGREREVAGPDVIRSRLAPKAGDTLVPALDGCESGASFEAWIRPAKGEAGRIFDKITAGTDDGILIDCWPDLSIRVIAGSRRRDHAAALRAETWHHIAVVITKTRLEVYLDGERQ